MSASDGDDGGITLIPIGPGSSTAAGASQRLPDWIYDLKPLASVASGLASVAGVLIYFGNNPVEFIQRVISFYIVGSIFAAGRYLVETVLVPFDILVGLSNLVLVGNEEYLGLLDIFGSLGAGILATLTDIQTQVLAVLAQAGPAAPIIAIGAASVGLYLLYRLAVAALLALPGGASIASLLGIG